MNLVRIASRVAFGSPLSDRYDYGTMPEISLPRGGDDTDDSSTDLPDDTDKKDE